MQDLPCVNNTFVNWPTSQADTRDQLPKVSGIAEHKMVKQAHGTRSKPQFHNVSCFSISVSGNKILKAFERVLNCGLTSSIWLEAQLITESFYNQLPKSRTQDNLKAIWLKEHTFVILNWVMLCSDNHVIAQLPIKIHLWSSLSRK